ncbi:uncharacterized protein LOC112576783 isoform X2 [Pomacea canaliculata]|uniref:uncharacterized protein LOC112576783 isoform X2 n=1 Tax=Pomacea canaliculata TaxID=400727 RepID=UPI000D72AF28|nr:uncharacterized protein LOC112576783 isoform X2 [Pomacea canaliculata]
MMKLVILKRLTHEISAADEPEGEPWKTRLQKRKSEEESAALAEVLCLKKQKTEDGAVPGPSKTSGSKQARKTVKHYKARKEKCKYWSKCYRKEKVHRLEFLHPGDSEEEDSEKDLNEETKAKRGDNKPLHELNEDECVKFNTGYKLERSGDVYLCSCAGWKAQSVREEERSCKHLKEYLGDDFEKGRLQNIKKKTYIAPHISVSVLLAHKYDENVHDPVGWWISEKLDGVRAFWNGRCFYSRLGNAFYAPSWFTADLPKEMHLDGELFGGRGQFQSTVSIVKNAECDDYKKIKYHVFDSPSLEKKPFEERITAIKDYFEEKKPKFAVFVEHTKCTNKKQLDDMLKKVLDRGGEGLMIRKPKSQYERNRSTTLLKIKKFYDAEAIVIGHEKGKGRNLFVCGALRCRMACGTEFSVGSGLSDKDRKHPPKIGSIITYKFQELTKGGHPRFPTFLGIRIDMTEPKDADIRPVTSDD